MTDPRIVPRAEHTLSRRDIDPDALRVLYRLRQGEHIAYLVGGSVRDLLLGRRPKDFDVGTSAHPSQVKKLFRNCWIIGRRFRLAHVKFGPKVIEVATFRRQVAPGEEVVADGVPAPDPTTPEGAHLIHHDNTFGTPEEDAFRRDFTINALFYDIATFSVIDYVGGLDDLRAGVVRMIGDPEVRLREDPVRMLRAIALASRLDFTIDRPILDAVRAHRHDIAKSSPPRLLEEYYKILRSGAAERTFRQLIDVGLVEPTSPELHRGAGDVLWRSLAALDAYRKRFEAIPETLTNPLLLGTLLVPLGIPLHQPAGAVAHAPAPSGDPNARRKPPRPPLPKLGDLPLARRDVERLQHVMQLQRRLHDPTASPRAKRGLTFRHHFRDALTWLDVHGGEPDLVEYWTGMLAEAGRPPDNAGGQEPIEDQQRPFKPRRRRRRRRRPHHVT
jgi:poly(A) polymerase